MAYRYLKQFGIFPKDILNVICSFTGPDHKWSNYWKKETINLIIKRNIIGIDVNRFYKCKIIHTNMLVRYDISRELKEKTTNRRHSPGKIILKKRLHKLYSNHVNSVLKRNF